MTATVYRIHGRSHGKAVQYAAAARITVEQTLGLNNMALLWFLLLLLKFHNSK